MSDLSCCAMKTLHFMHKHNIPFHFAKSQNQMIMQDHLEKEKADAKNAVEEYVYEMRSKLYEELEKFITEEVNCGTESCAYSTVF